MCQQKGAFVVNLFPSFIRDIHIVLRPCEFFTSFHLCSCSQQYISSYTQTCGYNFPNASNIGPTFSEASRTASPEAAKHAATLSHSHMISTPLLTVHDSKLAQARIKACSVKRCFLSLSAGCQFFSQIYSNHAAIVERIKPGSELLLKRFFLNTSCTARISSLFQALPSQAHEFGHHMVINNLFSISAANRQV